jgi:aryl-alcohol dehydrogenase-like predicted oxidoreductase
MAQISRRCFFAETAAFTTCSMLGELAQAAGAPAGASGSIRIGGDLRVNRIGLGTAEFTGPDRWGTPTNPRAIRELLRRAMDLGINMLDTADVYGPRAAEQMIYEALFPYPKDLVIATKGGQSHDVRGQPNAFDARPEQLRAACEGSLKRLRLEQIPLYYLHSPDPKVPYEDSIGELVRLQKQGKIRHIGVSNVDTAQMAKAQSEAKIAALQNSYNVLARQSDDFITLCERDHIAFIPNSPLGRRRIDPGDTRLAGLQMLAEKHHISFAQAVLAWLLARSPIFMAIPGTTQIEHLEEDVAAARVHFSRAEMREVG